MRCSATIFAAALVLLICAIGVAFAERPLVREFLDDPRAVCNDGTRGAYFIRKSQSQDPKRRNRWAIYLHGGFWCWNKATCDARWANSRGLMTSSLSAPTQELGGGIFSESCDVNPDFCDANVVTVLYCSSDTHSGELPDKSPLGWYFRGKVIVEAVVKQLQAKHGLGERGSNVLLTGGSAGGAGVLNNADSVRKLLRADELNIDYRVLVDSGIFGHIPVLNPAAVDDHEKQFRAGIALWQGSPNEQCAAAYSPADRWRCYMGDYVLAHVASPALVYQFETDWWVVNWGLQATGAPADPKHNATQKAYAQLVQRNTLETLRKVFNDASFNARNGSVPSLGFAPSCLWHTGVSANEEFVGVYLTDTKLSLRNVLHLWLTEPERLRADAAASKGPLFAEKCTELSCSTGCRN